MGTAPHQLHTRSGALLNRGRSLWKLPPLRPVYCTRTVYSERVGSGRCQTNQSLAFCERFLPRFPKRDEPSLRLSFSPSSCPRFSERACLFCSSPRPGREAWVHRESSIVRCGLSFMARRSQNPTKRRADIFDSPTPNGVPQIYRSVLAALANVHEWKNRFVRTNYALVDIPSPIPIPLFPDRAAVPTSGMYTVFNIERSPNLLHCDSGLYEGPLNAPRRPRSI